MILELDSTRSLLRHLLIQNEPIDKKISKFILGSDKLVIFLKFFSGCLKTLLGKGFWVELVRSYKIQL